MSAQAEHRGEATGEEGDAVQAFYQQKVLPVLDELEAQRREIVRRGLLVAAACVAGGIVASIIAVLIFRDFWPLALTIPIAYSGWYHFMGGRLVVFRSTFKRRVMSSIVHLLHGDMSYDSTGYVPRKDFVASRLCSETPDSYGGEDLVSGTHGVTKIRFSEVKARVKIESRDKNGRRQTRYRTIYEGLFFVADFNKHMSGLTIVEPDNAERLAGGLGRSLQSLGNRLDQRGELIVLEDPEFERAFKVVSTDQVEARYILSTSLMRRILELRRRAGKNIALSFTESCVFIGIPSKKDYFEVPTLLRPIERTLDLEQIQEFIDDLRLMLAIVDELDLNTRVWSKAAPAKAAS